MKILHVISTLDVGGAEMHILSQVRGQVARGHEVRVIGLIGQATLKPDFLAAGARGVTLVGSGPAALLRLRAHMRQADVIHTHLLRADFVGAAAALLWGRRKRLISGKHNDERALQRGWFARLHGLIGRLPVRTIVLSDHVARYMREVGRLSGKGMVTIHYGVDPAPIEAACAQDPETRAALRRELGAEPGDVVWICVARLAPQKAHDVLLEALAQARDRWQGPGRLRLWIVGDDPFGDGRARVTGWAQERGLLADGSAVLTGIRRDVPALLAAADGFVMPSRWEGLGLVFLEAMAARLPVLSTAVSAIPEVVVDGETGRLVPPDDTRALADAWLELSADAERRAAMGAAGAQRVRAHFAPDRMVESTLAVYREVAGQ
ncbi:MAG: glycosyltransferase [Planctomycetota bacterium]